MIEAPLRPLRRRGHATAWAEVERVSVVLAAGRTAFTHNQRANFHGLHGQVALAMAERTAAGKARDAFIAAAETDAEVLRLAATPSACATAALLDAGILALSGASADVVTLALRAASTAFDAADMPLAAAAARLRLGTWEGGDSGELLIARSEAFMRLRAIACPARWVMTTTPGLSPPT